MWQRKCEEALYSLLILGARRPVRHLASLIMARIIISKGDTISVYSRVSSSLQGFLSDGKRNEPHKIADRTKLSEDNLHSIILLGTCMNLVVDLCNNCVEGIHLVKNKSSKLQRLLQVKLAFSLEKIISLGKLVYFAGCLEADIEMEKVCFSVFKYGAECIRNVLHDSNSQVQAIGLQVLKGTTQRFTNNEEKTFLLFFVGELIGDVLTTIDMILKEPITKESMAIAVECLRFLVILQTSSFVGESQKTFMNLLLEAVVMVLTASSGSNLKELDELRSAAIKLVSHLAQIPSSAVIFKDVILSMPVMHRQQLQGLIRASVTQDQHPTQKSLSTPMLEIKAPALEVNREKFFPPHTTEANTEINSASVSDGDEVEDEDEDDWDTFQYFPASTRETIVDNVAESHETDDSEVLESSSPSGNMEGFTSLPIDELKAEIIEHEETTEEVSMTISPTDQRSADADLISDSSGMQGESENVDTVLNQEHDTDNETLSVQELSHVTEQAPSQRQLAEDVEVSDIDRSLEDHEAVDETPENKTDSMMKRILWSKLRELTMNRDENL